MEEVDVQASTHGSASRPVATPTRPGLRGSPSNQGRTPNMTSTARVKGDAHARPASAALSGWEDDSPLRGSDLLEYLGKDGVDSSTSPQAGAITGDLTQALLMARVAAEASVGGDIGIAHITSLKSQSSGGSYAGRTESKSRLALGSGSPIHGSSAHQPTPRSAAAPAPAPSEGDSSGQQRLAVPDPRMGEEVPPEGSEQAPLWSEGLGGAGGAENNSPRGDASAQAERLRGLLYSDDDDDGDDDYQDLMTADDDALFGGVGNSGSGPVAGKSNRGGGGPGTPDGGSRCRRSLNPAGESSVLVEAAVAPFSKSRGGKAAANSPSSGGSSAATTASGEHGPDITTSFRGGSSGIADVVAGAILATASATSIGGSGAADGSRNASPRRGGANDDADQDGSNGATSIVTPTSPQQPEGSNSLVLPAWAGKGDGAAGALGVGGGPATEALERILQSRITASDSLGPLSPLGLSTPVGGPMSPRVPHITLQDAVKAEPPVVVSSQAQGLTNVQQGFLLTPGNQNAGGLPQHQHFLHPQHQNQHLQHHYVHIPTPQIGEGLRQHPPPARRLYTPGQSNRSPIRGSGFIMSPPAVRSSSPSMSPGRALHSAVIHHHPPSQHQQAATRRLSSPSVTSGVLSSHRSRSPRESHTSAIHTAFAADGEETAPGGTLGGVGFVIGVGNSSAAAASAGGGPGLNSSVLKMGSWVTGTTTSASGAAAAAAGGSTGSGNYSNNTNSSQTLNLSQSSVSRFPPAHVQTFPGGQVYRSTPISQVPGSSSEEIARIETVSGGGAGGGGAGGAGAGIAGPAAAATVSPTGVLGSGAVRGSGSPGRMTGRAVRQPQHQPRATGASSSGGPVGSAGISSSYGHERFGGSFSAPARPSTSPHKPRSSGGARSSGLISGGPMSATPSTALFGNGSGSLGEAADALLAVSAAAAAITAAMPSTPRGSAVPALPAYPTAHGIRHCGFKQAAMPGGGIGGSAGSAFYGGSSGGSSGGGGGAFGPQFSTKRQKAAAAAVVGAAAASIDDRLRSSSFSKILVGAGAPQGSSAASQEYAPVHVQYGQSFSPPGSGDTFGSGINGFPAAAATVAAAESAAAAAISAAAAVAEPFPSTLQPHPPLISQQQQQQQSQQQQPQQLQVQRKGSLPHLQASLEIQTPHTGLWAHSQINHQQGPPPGQPGQTSLLALYGRSAAGRNGMVYEQGLPAVQAAQLASGVRNLSFDASRRAMPRA